MVILLKPRSKLPQNAGNKGRPVPGLSSHFSCLPPLFLKSWIRPWWLHNLMNTLKGVWDNYFEGACVNLWQFSWNFSCILHFHFLYHNNQWSLIISFYFKSREDLWVAVCANVDNNTDPKLLNRYFEYFLYIIIIILIAVKTWKLTMIIQANENVRVQITVIMFNLQIILVEKLHINVQIFIDRYCRCQIFSNSVSLLQKIAYNFFQLIWTLDYSWDINGLKLPSSLNIFYNFFFLDLRLKMLL